MRFNFLSSTVLLLNAHHLSASILRLDTLLGTPLDTPDTTIYKLANHYIGYDFLDGFQWFTENDPTHGRVDYVSKQVALDQNLTFASSDKFVMRADSVNVVSPDSRGRQSVRIVSNAAYSEYILILSLDHMPEGCATWPAFWTVSKAGPWPKGGEIDIIEGVNNNMNNLASLHTTPNCTQSLVRNQSGQTTTTDCDALVNYNVGCGVQFVRPNSFGPDFNSNGGGTYVAQLSATNGVKVWFWAKSDPSTPATITVTNDGYYPSQILVEGFGEPDAYFSLSPNTCDYGSHFDAHRIIFDLTFCGDWAGSAYSSSGCPGSCVDYVNTQPAAFKNAYWEISSLLVYVPT